MDLQARILLQNFRIHLQTLFHCFQPVRFVNFLNLLDKKILLLLLQNFLFLNLNCFFCCQLFAKNDFVFPKSFVFWVIYHCEIYINFNLMIRIIQIFILLHLCYHFNLFLYLKVYYLLFVFMISSILKLFLLLFIKLNRNLI